MKSASKKTTPIGRLELFHPYWEGDYFKLAKKGAFTLPASSSGRVSITQTSCSLSIKPVSLWFTIPLKKEIHSVIFRGWWR